MDIASFLPPNAVIAYLMTPAKKQALKQMAAHAALCYGLPEREVFLAVWERERLSSTAMGAGASVPHARLEGLAAPRAVFARLEKPIDFAATDGNPVDLVFLLLSPQGDNTEHLKALSRISRLLRDKPLCQRLRTEKQPQAIYQLLIDALADDA